MNINEDLLIKNNNTIYASDFKCKNMLNINTARNNYKVTYTIDGDNITVTPNGAYARVEYQLPDLIVDNKYTISLSYINDSNNSIRLSIYQGGTEQKTTSIITDSSGELQLTFKANSDTRIRLYANASNDSTIRTPVTFYNIQLESGSEVTDFTQFKEFENKIRYLTNEQIIGTWYDGKTLYKKTYSSYTTSEDNNNFYIELEIDTNKNIKKSYGVLNLSNYIVNIGSGDAGFGTISNVCQNPSGLIFIARTPKDSYGVLRGIEITIEYTKTID